LFKKLLAYVIIFLFVGMNFVSSTENLDIEVKKDKLSMTIDQLTGLAPNVAVKRPMLTTKLTNKKEICNSYDLLKLSSHFGVNMYGYCAANCPHGGGPCYFDTEDPTDINQLSNEALPNFATGGTYTSYEQWLVCDFADGVIFEIDPEDGTITEIGGGGVGLNGLAYDSSTHTLYGCSSTDLYQIDQETGDQEHVGAFNSGQTHIGIACDSEGTMYSWNVKYSGDSYLYEIDKDTGKATQLFSLRKTLTYAQDGDFFKWDDTLYLTAYITYPENGGYLCKVDLESEELTIVGEFENSAEITGSMIKEWIFFPEHDVGIKRIDKPEDGYATEDMDIEATVKNYGNNSETTDVKFDIFKCEEGPMISSENFTGTFPPLGWETDHWRQSDSNKAGGKPQEARVSKSWISQGKSSYIQTPPINCNGYEKVNVRFRLYADFSYPQHTFFYLKYRKNESSPWQDVSPWKNPVKNDIGPKYYEIDCYGGDEDIGEKFQVRWEHYCNYTYLNDIYLDDFSIYGCTGCEEYSDLVEDVEVPFDEEVEVEFYKWTPSEWHNQNFQDTWGEYLLSAYTMLDDDNSQNDKKQRKLSLYFPFLHDVGTIEFWGPESGPAQTFPVRGVIKNVGQYDECCFKTYAEIAEIDYSSSDELFNYNFSSCNPWPPDGWSRTHTNWKCSNSDNAGGSSPEARFYYYPIEYPEIFRLSSEPIDTTGYGAVEIQFKQYQPLKYGTYTMEIETSPDGATWDTVWSNWGSIGPETTTIITGENVGGDNFHIAFSVKTEYYSELYWSIDDLIINGFPLSEPEYQDEYCVSDLNIGEELVIDFDDWSPEFLQYETTGTKTYKARVWTKMDDPEDNNQANDEFEKLITLEYFHDVYIYGYVTSTSENLNERVFFAVDNETNNFVWFDPEVPGTFNYISNFPSSQFPQGATFDNDQKMWFCDIYGNIWYKEDPLSSDIVSVGNSGTGELTGLAYHEGNGMMYGCSSSTFYEIDMFTGKATSIGSFGCDGPMISIDCDRDGIMYGYDLNFGNSFLYSIDLDTGNAIKIGNTGVSLMYSQDMAYDYNEDTMYACAFNYDTYKGELHIIYLETGKFYLLADLYEGHQTTCLAIPSGFCRPFYISPGNRPIEAVAGNIGTFPEEDMTCTAEIYEFITNCTNATLVYEDNITDIDIPEPLGGTETLTFKKYNFDEEGLYRLILNITDDNDDFLSNNRFVLDIRCDGTPPTSWHKFDPPDPDGLNGWYVSDLEVTLNAADPSIGCNKRGSGVDYIVYEVDGEQGIIHGNNGKFTINEDGEDIEVVYWAVDNVGNEETPHHTFTIDMDQTPPDVNLTYTWRGKKPPYEFIFKATAIDAISGMERVEFWVNDDLYETVYGTGPEYVWETIRPPGQIIIKAIAYDMAGLSSYDSIENPTLNINSNSQSSSINDRLFENKKLHHNSIPSRKNSMNFLPRNKEPLDISSTENIVEDIYNVDNKDILSQFLDSDKRFYAASYTYPSDAYLVWFDPDDLSTLNEILKFPTSNFPGGGCFVKNIWWICDTNGHIFYVNPETGEIVSVGSSGTGELVDLAWDPKTNTLWGVSTSTLYSIDMNTGDATAAGQINIGSLLWDIAADMNGNLWGLALNSSGFHLYFIDTNTLNATQICNDIIIPVSEISYEKDEDVMWGINYNYTSSKSELWTIDINNCTTTLFGTFPEDNQIMGLAIPYTFSNQPPDKPEIDGEKGVVPLVEFDYYFSAIDPNRNDVRFHIDWGDGTTVTTDFYKSDETATIGHTYSRKGTVIIRAYAEDTNGAYGKESTYTVEWKTKSFTNSLLLRFLDNFPLFERLLNILKWNVE
jgi:hypothetical protein